MIYLSNYVVIPISNRRNTQRLPLIFPPGGNSKAIGRDTQTRTLSKEEAEVMRMKRISVNLPGLSRRYWW